MAPLPMSPDTVADGASSGSSSPTLDYCDSATGLNALAMAAGLALSMCERTAAKGKRSIDAPAKQCRVCGTTGTPKWRCGSLCNACGLRSAKHHRPVRRATARDNQPHDTCSGSGSPPAAAASAEQELIDYKKQFNKNHSHLPMHDGNLVGQMHIWKFSRSDLRIHNMR